MVRGIYDPSLAIKAFSYAAQDGMKKYAKEFGGLGLQRGEIGKTRMAIAVELLAHYEEELGDETNPMGEVDLPGADPGMEAEPTLDLGDKSKLKQLETIFKSMDPDTQQAATQLLTMISDVTEDSELDAIAESK